MTSTLPIPHPSVRYMFDANGRPTQQAFEFLQRLERVLKEAQDGLVGKADIATTLAGYGITDAEKLGVSAGVDEKSASYTLALTDKGKTIEMGVASANTLTVPPHSDVPFDVGTYINFAQVGAGQTTITPGSGVTIQSHNSALKTAGQWAVGTLYKRATNVWVAGGNLVV